MTGIVIIVVIIAAIAVIYLAARLRSKATVDDGAPMPVRSRRILVTYLLIFGTLLVYMLVSLNSVDFPETATLPEPVPIPTPTPTPPPAGSAAASPSPTPSPSPASTNPESPALYRVFPQQSTSSPPTISVALYGKNFKKDCKVRFNTKQEAFTTFISEDLIAAQLEPIHLVNVGAVSVDVQNPDGLLSNAISVPIKRPRVPLNVFGWEPCITREVQLLLLVIFAGALGSILHSLKSLADFIGNRTAIASWFAWYITRPYLGMSLALIFYAVLRGGFVVGSPADAKVVNPFGVLAIGALVGMFSDKAAQKLAEVFDVVFRSADTRSGKLDAPVIDRLEPDTVTAGETEPLVLKIRGDRLGKVTIVRLNADERKPDTVSEKQLTLNLRAEDVQKAGQIKITAVNPDGGASNAVTLHISDLAITSASLPDGKVGEPYAATMTASGGAQPYKWSLVTSPAWLSIDEKSGDLKGTPAAADAKATQVTVKVVDKDGSAAAKSLDLKVNAS